MSFPNTRNNWCLIHYMYDDVDDASKYTNDIVV